MQAIAPIEAVEGRNACAVPSVVTALVYGGAITSAILRFKHGSRQDLARPLGGLLARAVSSALDGVDAVLPVPLHPRRLRKRGFNQALLLAREARNARLSERTPFPAIWPDTLRRIRDTPSLGHEPADLRRKIVAGAFAVAGPSRVFGKRLLLIDDVMTTGATAAACTDILRLAGAREVTVAVLARVP